MTKFDDFFNSSPNENLENVQKLDGDYGCQICDKQSPHAYFNESHLEIFWYCEDEHRSSMKLG